MKNSLNYTTSIAALILAFATSPAFAAQSNEDDDTPKARARYVIKGGEVYDKKTNLTWQRCSVGQTWKEGVGCDGVIKTFMFFDTKRDWGGAWRVPSEAELTTLIYKNRPRHKPVIDEVAFPDMNEDQMQYWTTMPIDNEGWYIDFSNGTASFGSYKYYVAAVRLVRSGQ